VTGVRVGPDGHLYQLRTDRKTGVSVARYSLGTTGTTPPTTAPGSGSPQVTTPPATRPPAPEPTVVASPTIPAAPTADQQPTRWLIPGLGALAGAVLLALVAWRRYRRRARPVG
jgi:hypothetical protein